VSERDPERRARLKGRLVLLLKISVSAGILYWILTFVSLTEIFAALRTSHPGYFVASFLVALSANGVAAIRMRQLTACQGMSVSAPRIFSINLISSFYGMFLPGSIAGGAIRWRKLYLADKNALGAFVAMVLNRFLLTTMTVAVGAAYWIAAGRDQTDDRVGMLFFGLLAGLLLLQGSLMFGKGPATPSIPASDGGLVHRGRVRLQSVLGALRKYGDLPRGALLGSVALTLVEELLGLVAFFLMALAVGISVPLLHLGWIRSFVLLIALVPISFFGIGVQEGTLIALLGQYGVSGAAAVAFSFLLVARIVLLSLLGGLLEARDVFFPARDAVAGSGVGGGAS
jgi:uncharacterized membrane protein YbhN (UPF0104 family)